MDLLKLPLSFASKDVHPCAACASRKLQGFADREREAWLAWYPILSNGMILMPCKKCIYFFSNTFPIYTGIQTVHTNFCVDLLT